MEMVKSQFEIDYVSITISLSFEGFDFCMRSSFCLPFGKADDTPSPVPL